MAVKPLNEWMWERIPEMTRERDYTKAKADAPLDEWGRRKGPLRQLLDVLATGFQAIKNDADNIHKLIDIDQCPGEFLPHLAAMFGFEFPYDLSDKQQRAYLHSIISMYRTKGTAWTLRLAAIRVIGGGFDLEVANEDYVGKTFDVVLTAEGDATTPQLEQKIEYMVQQYSPAGMIPAIKLAYFFSEVAEQTMNDYEASSVIHASWRFNMSTHRLNDTIKFSDFGTTPLPF